MVNQQLRRAVWTGLIGLSFTLAAGAEDVLGAKGDGGGEAGDGGSGRSVSGRSGRGGSPPVSGAAGGLRAEGRSVGAGHRAVPRASNHVSAPRAIMTTPRAITTTPRVEPRREVRSRLEVESRFQSRREVRAEPRREVPRESPRIIQRTSPAPAPAPSAPVMAIDRQSSSSSSSSVPGSHESPGSAEPAKSGPTRAHTAAVARHDEHRSGGAGHGHSKDKDHHSSKHGHHGHDSHRRHHGHHGHHGHHDDHRPRFGISIGIGWSTCSSCGVRYHGHHSCSHSHVRYVSCHSCGASYHYGHSHVCSVRYVSCHSCGHRYHHGHHHVCSRPAVVFLTCGGCGVRYISGHHHSCSSHLTITYVRCGTCGISYRHGHHHACASHHAIYATCGSCGVRYLGSSHHSCARRSLSIGFGVGFHRCGSCGISYRVGSFHACNRPVSYFRCGLCGVSYRSTLRHTCAPAVVVDPVPAPIDIADAAELEDWSLLAGDKFDEALNHFDAAIAVAPDRAEAHAGRAIALGMTGRDTDAIAAMRRAVELDPAIADYTPVDAATQGVIAHLAEVYRKQAQAAQRPMDLWFMIGALEAARRNYAAASTALQSAINLGDIEPSTTSLQQIVQDKL